MTVHWIDEDWKVWNVTEYFSRFNTPHTVDAAFTSLQEVIDEWELGSDLFAISADNALDMVSALPYLQSKWIQCNP